MITKKTQDKAIWFLTSCGGIAFLYAGGICISFFAWWSVPIAVFYGVLGVYLLEDAFRKKLEKEKER